MSTVRLLLTGGTGFFGRALLRHWCEVNALPYTVTVVSRDVHGFLASYPEFRGLPWLDFFEADLLNPSALSSLSDHTHVLHAATESTKGPQMPPLERFNEILNGTRHLLEWSIQRGVQRFLLTSSGGVYGVFDHLSGVDEECMGMPDPLRKESAYGIGKRAAEHLACLYSSASLEVVIARCFAFVGQDLPLDAHFAIGNFLRDALWSEEIHVRGDGRSVRSYMDQRDLARWLIVLLFEGRAGAAYNVGSDEAIEIGALAERIKNRIAPWKEVNFHRGVTLQPSSTFYVPSIQKARHELGLKLDFTLDEAIDHAANCFRASGP